MNSVDKFFEGTQEQADSEFKDRLVHHNEVLRDNFALVAAVKESLMAEDYIYAAELWINTPEPVKDALWLAPTKGGVFTTQERAQLKSNDMYHATQSHFTEQTV